MNATLGKIYRLSDEDGGHTNLLKYLLGVHTGHSLGAVLSDLAGCGSVPSITFENPGSKPAIIKLFADLHIPAAEQPLCFRFMKENYNAYQAGVNLINTCNEQVGKTFRLDMPYNYDVWDKGPYFPITSSYLLNPYYVIGNTQDQHGIDEIAKKLASGNYKATEIQNPSGFNNGYIDYLDESHLEYWIGYFRYIWYKYPGMQDDFNKDIDKYMANRFALLKSTQTEARSHLADTNNLHSLNNNSTLFQPQQKNKTVDDIISEFVLLNKTF